MDYDATDRALAYDRGRDHGPEILTLWMNVVSSHVKDQFIETILDLGCGTGRFSEALAARFDAQVLGIDPSKKMLEQAQRKRRDRRVRYQLGRGEAIPLPNKSVDLIFMSMIFHHLEDPALTARECRRVLRDGGTAILRAGTRERISSYPYVPFFPASRPILEECLATGTSMRKVFESVGFRVASVDVVNQGIALNYGAYAEKLSAGADSVLARLSPDDFDAGMEVLRMHAAQGDSQPVVEPIDVFVFVAAGHNKSLDASGGGANCKDEG
jgi:ubiquinone/menaquinone biosynthesis C-methylase UbiE